MLRLRTFVGGGLPPNLWKLWSSSVAANLADGIISVALPIVAVRLTDSPAEVAGVAVASQIPSLLFGLLAGGLADRLDRRWTMVAVQVLRIAVLSVLVVLAFADGLTIVVLYVAAFVIGTGEARTVRYFCETAFGAVGLDYRDHVIVDPKFLRPAEVELLVADPARAHIELGWTPTVTLEQLVTMMVEADLERHSAGR